MKFPFFLREREQLERINEAHPKEGWGARQDSCIPCRMDAMNHLFLSQNPEPAGSNCEYPRAWKYHSYNPQSLKFASSWRKTRQVSSWFSWKVSPDKLWKEDWEPAFFSFQPFLGVFFLFNKTLFMMVDKTFLSPLIKAFTSNAKGAENG